MGVQVHQSPVTSSSTSSCPNDGDDQQKCAQGVPDMTILSNIDEIGINNNLRIRYNRNKIYVSIILCCFIVSLLRCNNFFMQIPFAVILISFKSFFRGSLLCLSLSLSNVELMYQSIKNKYTIRGK